MPNEDEIFAELDSLFERLQFDGGDVPWTGKKVFDGDRIYKLDDPKDVAELCKKSDPPSKSA